MIVLGVASIIYLGLIGSFVSVVSSKILAEREAAACWSVAPGMIVEAQVESVRASKGGKQFRARVRYLYDIVGNRYESTRYAFFPLASSDIETQQAVLDRFSLGSPVDIHYNPRDPDKAVLDVEFAFFPWSIMLWLLPLLALGGVLLFVVNACCRPAPKAGRAAPLLQVDSVDELVVAKSRTSPMGWATLVMVLVPTAIQLTYGMFGQRRILDRWTLAIMGATLVMAAAAAALCWLKRDRLEGALRIDRRRARYAFPASGQERDILRVQEIELRSEPASAVKKEPISVKHSFSIRTATSIDPLFEFVGDQGVAEDLLEVLRVELCA